MLYPLTFHPIFKERIWGGRNLQNLYGKAIPEGRRIGESWELTDRPEGVSVISNGPLAGKDLHWLMTNRQEDLLGSVQASQGRFPLLIKILDAEEKLSLQVHPPAGVAARLGGEPKTEMWYIANATTSAELYVGLKRGVTRETFEKKIFDGTVAECFYRIPVRRGDAMFLPSGRVHAIGAGNVIFEIQQNSDTTYRVFDWNRVDDDGKPRDLHVEQSLASINFTDFEPALISRAYSSGPIQVRPLVSHRLFNVEEVRVPAGTESTVMNSSLVIMALLSGRMILEGSGETVELRPGQFCLLPGSLSEFRHRTETNSAYLRVTA